MSTLTAPNFKKPPAKINQLPSSSQLVFSSLPNDIVLDILARVPKHYYPILSCVSKKLQILVRSPEIQRTRSLYSKDSLYICFSYSYGSTCNWFTLHRMEKNPVENLFVSIDFPSLPHPKFFTVVAVGPEIFFIHSSSLWIFNSRSGKFRQGPNLQVELMYLCVGLVGSKIYVIGLDGTDEKIHTEFFDLKTQTWNPAPIPKENNKCYYTWTNNVALDRKVCALSSGYISCYDTRDGAFERFEFANERWSCKGVCVIDNVMYVYYNELGLMWYDSKLRQWNMVNGLNHLEKNQPVGMAEYYGKLAYIWTEPHGETKQIWFRMIGLDKSEVGIHGIAEPSQLLRIVPLDYIFLKCLSLSG